MKNTIDAKAARIARNQYGLITRHQLFQLGCTEGIIQRHRSAGRWVTVEKGVYLINGAPRTWHVDVLAPCLAYDGLASHRSCAHLLGVDGFRPGAPEISVAPGRHVLRNGGTAHERLDFALAWRERRMIQGIPTTSPRRLVADLGAVVPFPIFEAAVDDLIRRDLLTWDSATDSLLMHARRGRDGVGALRQLLNERFGDDVGDSVLERAFTREGRRRGLPQLVPQFRVHDQEGFIARVDYAVPAHRIAIELDSLQWHLNRRAFEADPRKRNRMRLAGWLVLEYTRRMVLTDPNTVFGQIEQAIGERHLERDRTDIG